MKKKFLKIKRLQYIGSVLKKGIPSNRIIEKPTGSGITSEELEALRNSLVVEANRPVIKGKAKYYNKGNTKRLKIRTVHDEVEVADIIAYLQSDVEFKKILTTPEGYWKVVAAFEELNVLDEMYKNYFILFDECEKTIQDIDYREDIIKPIDDFFKFKKKAFVSATPIIPSDPRFEEQKFVYLVIEPDYDSRQEANLIITNNTVYSLKKHLDTSPKERYFIFLNSTRSIVTFINYLDIKDESMIFCSEDSKNSLKLQGYPNTHEHLCTSDKFAKYNFFTCRFNSAVDILDVLDPYIVIITDVFLAEHTKVDPFSEIKQIVGRFRRPVDGEINRHLTHITNVNPNLISTSKEQIHKDVEAFKMVHTYLTEYRDSATSAFAKSVVEEMLERSEFSKYVRKDGSTNHFMVDNAVYQNMVNGYYQTKEALIHAYNESKNFDLTSIDYQSYELTDEHTAAMKNASKFKPPLELLLPILNQLHQTGLDDFEVQLQLKQIQKEHPTAYKAFQVVGFERATELKFNYRKIMAELNEKETTTQNNHFGFLSFLQKEIKIGKMYTIQTIKAILRKGLKQFNLTRLKPNLELLERYFNISARTYIETENGKKKYGYYIIKYKFGIKI